MNQNPAQGSDLNGIEGRDRIMGPKTDGQNEMERIRVIIAAGGTGGHLFPGIALAHEFRRREARARITFVGTARGLETKIIPKEKFELRLIPATGWVRLGGFRKIMALLRIPGGLWRSWRILKEVRPHLVLGVGGYASGPVMMMAVFMRLPRALLEPNTVPGLTNRLLAPWVDRVYLAFEETQLWLDQKRRVHSIRVLGNPIRREIISVGKESKKSSERFTLLVMGGSQGSQAINQAMAEALAGLESLKGRLRIIHQTGERDVEALKKCYSRMQFEAVVVPFLDPISEAYRKADLVVCRSGATTVAELTACARPAILIPFPYATHGHQERNARVLMEAGAAEMILERDLTGKILADRIQRLLEETDRFQRMTQQSRRMGRPEAAERIVSDCLALAGLDAESLAGPRPSGYGGGSFYVR